MIKAILFDLDGTLLDRDASLKQFINGQHSRLNDFLGHVPLEDFKSRFVELDSRGYVWKDKVYQTLINEFEIQGISWSALLEDYMTQFNISCVPFPELIQTLEHLHKQNLLLGMITNGFTSLQWSNIKALGIEQYFSTILVSEEVGLRKPDPEIFIAALKQLGVSPQESMYVGDHPMNDVQAAQQVGMIGVWKKDDYWGSPQEGDFIIEHLTELIEIVKQLQTT